jgi:hypothetical protein
MTRRAKLKGRHEMATTMEPQELNLAVRTPLDEAGNDYTSRPGALIWFFRQSRDRWKKKHQELKATVKGFTNQIAAVTNETLARIWPFAGSS